MPALNQMLKSRSYTGNILAGAGEMKSGFRNLIDYPRLPSYVFPFDYAVGGGIPLNVITQFYGSFQSGKTTISYMIAKALAKTCMRCLKPLTLCKCKEPNFALSCPTCKKPFGECTHKSVPVELCLDCGKSRIECVCGTRLVQKTFLAQMEGMPPDELYFETLGYNHGENMIIGVPDYGEMGCAMIEEAVKSDDCGLVILDSLAGLVPKAELEAEYTDFQVAGQARLIAKLFRRLSTVLVNEFRRGHLVGVIFINQIRSVIGASRFEPGETTPGGHSSKHGYRLSVRVSQLSVDKEKNEQDDDGMKNVLRFSASLLGPSSKQQLLILAGKAEYKLVIRPYEGFLPGDSMDSATVIAKAKEYGMLEKVGDKYVVKGTNFEFRVLSDIAEMFKTHEYQGIQGADDVLRFLVLQRAKERAVREIKERSSRNVQVLQPRQEMPEVCEDGAE